MAGSVVAMVKSWESHCLDTHAECRALSAQRTEFPTRLLDMHEVDREGVMRIIEVESNLDCEYVALSYCWGRKHPTWISYVKRCQATQQRVVHVEQMPQTPQDAVISCLKLGYSYIWIDCLCILQGNKADWLQEGAKMCDIYANAVLTISASDSKDCRDGFLVERSALQQKGAVLSLLDEQNEVTSQLHLCLPDTAFQKLVGNGPVAQRGWCLQERNLCPRRLHICQGEVFFECILCRRFESEAVPGEEFNVTDEHYAFHMPREAHADDWGKPSPVVRNIFSWCAIMQDYTRRGLAMTDDKLVAVAGLARRAHHILGPKYLAGLWEPQIHVGLLWMIDEDASASRAKPYRAPSWSWASMDGPVSWSLIDGWVQSDDGFVESAIEVMGSTVQLEGEDPFGPVQTVEIVVRGRLKLIPAERLLANKVLTYPAWMSGSSPHVGSYLADEKTVLEGEMITCLKVATRPFGPGPSLPPTNEVVVLRKIGEPGGDDTGTYERIGFGQILVTDYFDDCAMSTIRLR